MRGGIQHARKNGGRTKTEEHVRNPKLHPEKEGVDSKNGENK